MKYLSVCSGIEAATVAWHGLGWTPVAFAEVEAFPSAVLAHHYPTVPNLGDLTRYREWPEELLAEVDLLVGGTPCQAFSVAGLRKSLDDERGNLSLVYVNLFHHLNEVRRRHGRRPIIALWENVPGVLSTKDNAFGCFIGGLLGCDEAPATESGKWDKAGFLSSETVRVGYRVLDAQYFGVAQRRRRVFLVAVPGELVASLGELACPSEILSLRESVLGNPPTRGTAWEGVARATADCPASGSGCGEPYYLDRASFNQGENAQYDPQITNDGVAGSAVARGPAAVLWNASDQANAERLVDHAGTLNCNKGQRGGWIAGNKEPVIFTGDGVTADPISAHEARTYTHEGLNFRLHNCVGRSVCATGDRSHALTTRSAVEEDGTGRETPIVPAVAFTKAKRAQSNTDDESWVPGEVAPTQNQFDQGDTRATTVVAFRENTRNEVNYVDPPQALASGGGKPGQGYCGVQVGMQVRRLTPRECAYLQGFPPDYLDITFRKKPAADGPKYRALGNSMAVPCMWWLGMRIHNATSHA